MCAYAGFVGCLNHREVAAGEFDFVVVGAIQSPVTRAGNRHNRQCATGGNAKRIFATLIQSGVSYELGGRVDLAFEDDGVRCEMVIPV